MMTTTNMLRYAPIVVLLGATACGTTDQRLARIEAAVAQLAAAREVQVGAARSGSTSSAPTGGSNATSPATRPPPSPSDNFEGWLISGTNMEGFTVVHDHDVKQAGAASARVECVVPTPNGFGGIMQTIAADAYRGERVRFSAVVRTRDVAGWAGLWMRVDRPSERASAFDNMQDRSIKGTADWRRHEVVLDVADDAVALSYGLLLADGQGTAWLDDAVLEVVDASVPVTDLKAPSHAVAQVRPSAPVNLSLDH